MLCSKIFIFAFWILENTQIYFYSFLFSLFAEKNICVVIYFLQSFLGNGIQSREKKKAQIFLTNFFNYFINEDFIMECYATPWRLWKESRILYFFTEPSYPENLPSLFGGIRWSLLLPRLNSLITQSRKSK